MTDQARSILTEARTSGFGWFWLIFITPDTLKSHLKRDVMLQIL
jgi:hypothetical protein